MILYNIIYMLQYRMTSFVLIQLHSAHVFLSRPGEPATVAM